MKGRRRRTPPLQWVRYAVQAMVAALVLLIVIAKIEGQTWAANAHTICPLGGVVNLYTYFSDGGYVAKLHSGVFITLLALLLGLVLTGKSFCGWICPMGSVQQALGGLSRRLWPRAYNKIPRWLERVLQYLKWAVLIWVLVQTARTAELVFQEWDPYFNLYHIWTDEVAISGYAVTAATLLLALFIPRPFCRYACPLGAFNGLFNSFSLITIKRDAESCTSCGRCTKVCPVNIDLCATATIRSIECTRCLKCVDVCPRNAKAGDTLKLHTRFSSLGRRGQATDRECTEGELVGGRIPETVSSSTGSGPTKRRSVSTWLFASVAVLAFALPILITTLSGDFQITGGQGGGGGGGGGGQSYESVEPGTVDGSVVRGSTTLAGLQALGVDLSAFLKEFGIPADISVDARLGELSEQYGFTVETVRTYLDEMD